MSPTAAASARPHGRGGQARVERRAGPSADNQVVGALLILLGIAWLLQRSGVVELAWETILAALLVVLGIGMVLTARRHGGSGLVIIGVLLSIALTATSSLDVAVLRSGVGQRSVVASDMTEARRVTSLFVGDLAVDLAGLDVPEATSATRLAYRLGVGDLQVILPPVADDVAVRVETSARMGQIEMFGENENGSNLDVQFEDDHWASATRLLVLHLDVGIGKVTVSRPRGPALTPSDAGAEGASPPDAASPPDPTPAPSAR